MIAQDRRSGCATACRFLVLIASMVFLCDIVGLENSIDGHSRNPSAGLHISSLGSQTLLVAHVMNHALPMAPGLVCQGDGTPLQAEVGRL